MIKKYKVLKDSSEKKGWIFDEDDNCSGCDIKSLDTGDYTIEGYEDFVCIERKATAAEVAQNLIQPRFFRELERMLVFPVRLLVLEFSMQDLIRFPEGSSIPDRKKPTKLHGGFLLKELSSIQLRYGIHPIFCDNRHNAYKYTCSLFKRIVNNEF